MAHQRLSALRHGAAVVLPLVLAIALGGCVPENAAAPVATIAHTPVPAPPRVTPTDSPSVPATPTTTPTPPLETIPTTETAAPDDAAAGSTAEMLGFEPATVTRVIDGDTVVVDLAGVEERVRVLGIDAPERGDEPGFTAATNFVQTAISSVNGQVYLVSGTRDRDVYDRLLREVWLGIPTDATDPLQLSLYNLSQMLLDECLAVPFGGGSEHLTEPASCRNLTQVVGEISWDDAANHAGSIGTVCGPLAGTGRSGGMRFLNLGVNHPDPNRFTIVLFDIPNVPSYGIGTVLCATGEIELFREVPQIGLSSLAGLEVVD
ncbi:MAG: thermonuclease family protein [Promicromonosporaceae bacterium]|nr:thermonuclease family protein [Promicromonosporaceae bacterium]